MKRIRMFALSGAALAVVLGPAGALAANGPKVTIRVEGKTRTLLSATSVQTHTGSVTTNHPPAGTCPASTAAGALDVATRHRWGGKVFASTPGIFVTSILGDTEPGTSFYWEIFLNNRAASAGACGVALRRGDQLLFAVVPSRGVAYPIGITAPHTGRVGHSLAVKVVWFNASGIRQPLVHARVTGSGISAVTSSRGIAQIRPAKAGRLVLQASRSGYIRAQSVRVSVQK